jgi:hypothetical protein
MKPIIMVDKGINLRYKDLEYLNLCHVKNVGRIMKIR